MRYTQEIEDALIEQIECEPSRPVILPAWAYWGQSTTCVAQVDGMWVPVMRILYQELIGPLPEWAGLRNPPGVDKRNVNPRLALVTPRRHSRTHCPKGHRYQIEDFRFDVGQVCHVCLEARKAKRRKPEGERRPTVGDINRAKTHCPRNHPLEGDNLVRLRSGKRKCRICHLDDMARYRARKKENASS